MRAGVFFALTGTQTTAARLTSAWVCLQQEVRSLLLFNAAFHMQFLASVELMSLAKASPTARCAICECCWGYDATHDVHAYCSVQHSHSHTLFRLKQRSLTNVQHECCKTCEILKSCEILAEIH